MAIHGVVYDLTEYAPDHPSGPEYVWDRCGTDGTVDYDRFHKTTTFLDVVAAKQMGAYEIAAEEKEETVTTGESGTLTDGTIATENIFSQQFYRS